MRRHLFSVALMLSLGCASSGRPPSIPEPAIYLRPVSPIFFGSGATAPVTIDVEITNRANVPLTVREIEVSSPGMAQYTLYRTRRIFNETLQPGETRALSVFATAVTRVRTPSEPLTVRAVVTLRAEDNTFVKVVNQMV